MQIYNVTNTENSIVHRLWDLVDANITTLPLARSIGWINVAYEELVGLIINADGTWQYDDTNLTTHPRGKGTLIEGQEDYSFASEYLQIEAVDVLDTNTQYRRLKSLDHRDFKDISPQEYFGVDASGNPSKGFPEYFDQNGDTIRLYKAPTSSSVTLTNGLRVWFKRKPDLFTTADTTQEPGLPSPYHVLLAYKASIPYAAQYKPKLVPFLEKTVDRMTIELIEHYSHREKARDMKISGARRSFR